ncbi:MAG TPA: pyridoxal 5'-phosphate synthase glutaminase subunit PdxT [Candidatus Dormibacteraeota bacterium]|nr:pyridoxal 5'-phosphate synthase glutaminase subunit PdxT [Candidatus Dormibacteraeota bacterium]
MANEVKIGIVAIQGDYEAHAKMLDRLGVKWTYVRRPADIDGVAGIILPGGESTTHVKVLREEGLWDALQQFYSRGGAFFGTCAGAILLAHEVRNPTQASLGLLNVSILRNGYGRQLASDVHEGKTKLSDEPMEMVFIRAPIIESVGEGVEVLAKDAAHPVLVQQGRILAATFHPELTSDLTIHRHFVEMLRHKGHKPANEEISRSAANSAEMIN